MKFEIAKSQLLDSLQTALLAVPTKSTLQILNNFLFNLEGNVLEVSATDLDLGIRLKLEVQGLQDGSIVVNARKLVEIVKEQKDQAITITVEDYQVKIQAAGFKANITGFDAMEFPAFQQVQEDKQLSINSSELQFLAEKTLFAVSNDVTRLSLNGIYCEHEDGIMTFAATDGHRLGKAQIEHDGGLWNTGVIVPPKALGYILKIANMDTPLDIKIDETHICFSTEKVQVISKLIEGPYPKYQNVIPNDFEKIATLEREEAISVIRRIATMANIRTRQITVVFNPGQAEVLTRNQDLGGECREPMSLDYQGEDNFRVGFNASYLLEILKMCPSDQIRIKMNSSVGACILEPIGEGLDFFFLIMPLRLVEES